MSEAGGGRSEADDRAGSGVSGGGGSGRTSRNLTGRRQLSRRGRRLASDLRSSVAGEDSEKCPS